MKQNLIMSNLFLGVDIGGTKCAVCIGTHEGQIIKKETLLTHESKGPEQAIDRIFKVTDEIIRGHQLSEICAIGIACGSPLDPYNGIIQSPPNLPSWIDVPIVDLFHSRYKVPTFLDNDANAGALAEYSFGAGRGYRNLVFITFGTGCGAGLILDGRIYRGTNCYAGEVGHFRLEKTGPIGYRKAGSFEGFCSGGGIAQLFLDTKRDFCGKTSLSDVADAKEIGDAARNGDELAIEVLEKSGHYLGKGLSYILDILNPELVIIGSIFVRCEQFLRPSMEKALKDEALEQCLDVCKIVPAGLGERVGDFAALSVGFYGVNNPKT